MTDEVERLNEIWLKAWFEKDSATVESLMTADYEYVAPNGQVWDRSTILGIIRSPRYRLNSGGSAEVKIVDLGPDVAAIQLRWQGTGEYEGAAFTDNQRCTRICVRREGRWLIAYEQCSPIFNEGER